MDQLSSWLSPRTFKGALVLSVAVHVFTYGGVYIWSQLDPAQPEINEEFLDLGYEVFDEPPQPAEEVRKVQKSPTPEAVPETKSPVVDAPKELQDDNSDVAGTQVAKPETNIGSDSNGNAASTPYYKIKPKYPRAALLAQKEGWVLLEIDIKEDGSVDNVRVLDGEERDLFQSEARRSVVKWRYRPFVNNEGQPIRMVNHQVKVTFKLEDAQGGS